MLVVERIAVNKLLLGVILITSVLFAHTPIQNSAKMVFREGQVVMYLSVDMIRWAHEFTQLSQQDIASFGLVDLERLDAIYDQLREHFDDALKIQMGEVLVLGGVSFPTIDAFREHAQQWMMAHMLSDRFTQKLTIKVEGVLPVNQGDFSVVFPSSLGLITVHVLQPTTRVVAPGTIFNYQLNERYI